MKPKLQFAPPDWVPAREWEEFVKMRVKIRKPLTPHAMELAIGKLDKLRSQGEDLPSVLNRSIFNCWTGLFPVSNENGNRFNCHTKVAQPRGYLCSKCGKRMAAEEFVKHDC